MSVRKSAHRFSFALSTAIVLIRLDFRGISSEGQRGKLRQKEKFLGKLGKVGKYRGKFK